MSLTYIDFTSAKKLKENLDSKIESIDGGVLTKLKG